jgi:hypothetical protein
LNQRRHEFMVAAGLTLALFDGVTRRAAMRSVRLLCRRRFADLDFLPPLTHQAR